MEVILDRQKKVQKLKHSFNKQVIVELRQVTESTVMVKSIKVTIQARMILM